MNSDLDLYQTLIEYSNYKNIPEFSNGFYSFLENQKNFNKFQKENFNKENIEKLKLILKEIKFIISEKLGNYFFDKIEEDVIMFKESENKNDFNMSNVFRVIIEEKKVRKINLKLFLDFVRIYRNDRKYRKYFEGLF